MLGWKKHPRWAGGGGLAVAVGKPSGCVFSEAVSFLLCELTCFAFTLCCRFASGFVGDVGFAGQSIRAHRGPTHARVP